MGRRRVSNDTQPEEEVPRPSCVFEEGQTVYIKRHQHTMGGIQVTFGGLSGKFVNTSFGPNGEEYVTVYHDGFRTFPLEHARKKKGSRASVTGSSKSGKLIVECAGLDGKPCSNTREIHAADKHLVKRCKDCQKEYARITNRERMRQRRAEKKRKQREAEASKKKEMGRDS